MRIVAIVQARLNSSRLKNKVIKTILHKPMIIHQLQRISKSSLINDLILAVSYQDDLLVDITKKYGFNVFIGNEDNVLKRFYNVANELYLKNEDIIIRLTGDCPLMDYNIVDECIRWFLDNDCDYISNFENPIYPDGLDVEVFDFKTLRKTYKNAKKKSELEHVTSYIRNSNLFKTIQINKKPIYPNWRLCVDNIEDFILVDNIFKHFKTTNFSLEDIISFLEKNKKLLEINSHIKRNEGYEKSLRKDNDT